ncbi:MAG TPA: hypothetical protein DHW64_11580 [Chitinophagaceae bacterium]|nr:hypothetical protein [Chitinophagaceae bacterium]
MSWGYFHFGRYSFSTPGWWVPKAKPDTAKKEKAFTVEDPAANYLRWAAQQGISNTFTEWKVIQHPDFPGQKVEVGGIDPYVMNNPPYKMADAVVKKNTEFLVKLASYQAEIDIVNLKTEKLANGLTRISLDVVNKGNFSTHSKLGERNYFLKKVKVALQTTAAQDVIGGRKIQLLNSIEANGSNSFSWVVKGTGKLTVEAGCPTAGTKTIEINL